MKYGCHTHTPFACVVKVKPTLLEATMSGAQLFKSSCWALCSRSSSSRWHLTYLELPGALTHLQPHKHAVNMWVSQSSVRSCKAVALPSLTFPKSTMYDFKWLMSWKDPLQTLSHPAVFLPRQSKKQDNRPILFNQIFFSVRSPEKDNKSFTQLVTGHKQSVYQCKRVTASYNSFKLLRCKL